MYFVYSLLMGLAAILLTPYWLIQGIRHGKYLSNLKERLGLAFPALQKLPAERPGAIWSSSVATRRGVGDSARVERREGV